MNIDERYNSNFLYFEEKDHRYTDTMGNEYLSVTTFIGKYHEKFDAAYWARRKAKEQGKTEKQILKEWDRIRDEACERGTNKHNGIEDAIKDVSQFKDAIKYLTMVESGRCVTVADIPNLIPRPLDIERFKEATGNKYEEIYRVFDYYTARGYTIYSEIALFLMDYLISGTIDILCIRDTDFVILDWKTNRDGLKFESGYYKKDKTTIPNLIPKPLDVERFKEATGNKYDEIYRVFDYYTKAGYTIYSEIALFLMDYLISGTIDILCIRDNDFVILDWKTNRDGLKFESGYYKKDKTTIPNQLTNEWVSTDKRMLPPLSHMQDCNGNHYTMQLSLYAIGVEMILGIPCVGLGLCHIGSAWKLNAYGQPLRDKDGYHIDPDKPDTVNWYRIDYRRNEALAMLKDRYMNLKAENKNSNKQLSLDF